MRVKQSFRPDVGIFIPLPLDRQDFGLIHNDNSCREESKNHTNDDICFRMGRKTLREEKKKLVTSIFFFSVNVFKNLLLGCVNLGWKSQR